MKETIAYTENLFQIRKHPKKGFCVHASQNIKKDTLICTNAVGFIGFKDLTKKSEFHHYPMWWNNKTDCIAFGCINLLNHGSSNVKLVRDRKKHLIHMYANRDLKKGEELFIEYACELWFKPV